jgi:hypothetical protein
VVDDIGHTPDLAPTRFCLTAPLFGELAGSAVRRDQYVDESVSPSTTRSSRLEMHSCPAPQPQHTDTNAEIACVAAATAVFNLVSPIIPNGRVGYLTRGPAIDVTVVEDELANCLFGFQQLVCPSGVAKRDDRVDDHADRTRVEQR